MTDEVRGVPLVGVLADKTRPVDERVAAAEALARLANPGHEAWRVLCGIFQDGRDEVEARVAAVRALGQISPSSAPNQLVRPTTSDPERRVRAEAVATLARIGEVQFLRQGSLLRDLVRVRDNIHDNAFVNLSLSYGRDPRVLSVLREALRHPDSEVRHTAQWELGSLGEMDAVIEALYDETPSVRAGAAETIGRYGLLSQAEVSALESALGDADEQVRRAAEVALRRLGVRSMSTKRRAKPSTQVATPASASRFDWTSLLAQWSTEWLRVRDYAVEVPDEVVASGWLGFLGAGEEELLETERRLGVTLPPSYREFLRVTNG